MSDPKGYFIKNVTGYTADFKPTNPVELLQRVIDFKTKTDDLKDAMGANPDNKKDEKAASTKPASDADGSNAAQKPKSSTGDTLIPLVGSGGPEIQSDYPKYRVVNQLRTGTIDTIKYY